MSGTPPLTPHMSGIAAHSEDMSGTAAHDTPVERQCRSPFLSGAAAQPPGLSGAAAQHSELSGAAAHQPPERQGAARDCSSCPDDQQLTMRAWTPPAAPRECGSKGIWRDLGPATRMQSLRRRRREPSSPGSMTAAARGARRRCKHHRPARRRDSGDARGSPGGKPPPSEARGPRPACTPGRARVRAAHQQPSLTIQAAGDAASGPGTCLPRGAHTQIRNDLAWSAEVQEMMPHVSLAVQCPCCGRPPHGLPHGFY